jgi:hypothetical protein
VKASKFIANHVEGGEYSHFLFVASVATASAMYPRIENDVILDDGG